MLETLRRAESGTDVLLGSGNYTFRVVVDWAKLPKGYSIGDVGSVTVDSKDNVYVFNRGDHPMLVFDRNGNFLTSWGEGIFKRPHAVHMGSDDTVYCTDDGAHTVTRCTLDGKVLLQLGIPGEAKPFMSGEPFNRCTHTALSPENDIYVSDGYGNASIHKFSADGKLIKSWGGSGTDPGQFNIPHNICCDADGWVYVADRENHRVQIFDGNGNYEAQWNNLHRPLGLAMRDRKDPIFYISEGGPSMRVNRKFPNLGARVSIVTKEGKPLARLGDTKPGLEAGQFLAPHGIGVDSRGDIYVGETTRAAWKDKFPDDPVPETPRTLQKLERVPSA